MQNTGFSETQFAFNFVSEFVKKNPLCGMPFFPDTYNEGKHYGFDVCVGNYFFQFKKSGYFDINDNPQAFWNAIGNINYYKIEIKTDRKQYKFLKKISQFNNRFNKVLYATPEFHTRRELKSHYTNSTTIDSTALFSLNDFPNGLAGNHHLIYRPTLAHGILFSDPSTINKSTLEIDGQKNIENKSSIFNMAKKIADILFEVRPKKDVGILNRDSPEKFVRSIWTILVSEYEIYWFPLISNELLKRY